FVQHKKTPQNDQLQQHLLDNPAIQFELLNMANGHRFALDAMARYSDNCLPGASERQREVADYLYDMSEYLHAKSRGLAKGRGPQAPVGYPGDLRVWYHPPDYRFGKTQTRGLLQFATDEKGKLHYRSFSSSGGSFAFEGNGEAKRGGKQYA